MPATSSGPDFPTGGTIFRFEERRNPITGERERVDAIREMYAHGRGRVVMRAQVAFEEIRGEPDGDRRHRAAVPGEQGRRCIEKIADLVKDKKIDGIADLRDESRPRRHAHGHRDQARRQPAQGAEQPVQAHARCSSAFNMNMLALVDGQPQTLPLKAVLQHHIDYRREVVRRRTEFDLGKARDRAHILEGLKIALDNLDAVIKTIRESADVDAARDEPDEPASSCRELQAKAILDMRLRPARRARAQEDRGRVPRGHPAHRRARGHPRQPGPRPRDHQGRADAS